MEQRPKNDRPRCRFCGQPLSKEDAEIPQDTCFDCALIYQAGGAAHTMAEAIKSKKREEQARQPKGEA